jgi:hypothetical protein
MIRKFLRDVRADWRDLAYAAAALIVAGMCLTGAVKYLARGDKVTCVLLCILALAVAVPALLLGTRKLREGAR